MTHLSRVLACLGFGRGGRRRPRPKALDPQLARLREELWPDESWRSILTCPTPKLTGYDSRKEARAHTTRGGAQPRRCRCGRWHLRWWFTARRPRR